MYIGLGAKIPGNVTLGDGAVVGANAVVLTDAPKLTVFAGMPARYIRDMSRSNSDRYCS